MIKNLDIPETETVMDIWLKVNITAHQFIPEHYWIRNYSVVKEQYLPVSTTFVYKEDGMIKAFISVIDNSFIGALFVSEEYQGQGIGKKLLDHCKYLYSGLELSVYTKNIQAINFYKKCGFIIRKKQLNEDSGFWEYIMSWKIEA
ncbi:N-acetyltransferase [Methanolobus halotolerans]|uniref:N-acetyltransferase n=1 Tax=Methanolobus halotolerans TaxID=2052935 RepID=A0A4E0PVS5_9EURY|nr:N-acetyltransferase [Methanolobus halotolerans]TGC08331.1 N-acetyltransferase [Methanolobus halotolerans]